MTGAVAAGQEHTAQAAMEILKDGGNAFDAVLAAMVTAAVAEPVLASLGGGGFLTASPAEAKPVCYDFFVHTPGTALQPEGADFRPVVADFGPAQQEFHVGLGTMAVPGVVDGLFVIHERLGSLPLARIVEPACRLAREGYRLSSFQSYLFGVVGPIYLDTPEARALFDKSNDHSTPPSDSPSKPSSQATLIGEGDVFRNPEQADFLDVLVKEGRDLFYRGEIAQSIVRACDEGGGVLTVDDFADFTTIERSPLGQSMNGWDVYLNPPPSTGGVLVAIAARVFQDLCRHGGSAVPDTRADALARPVAGAPAPLKALIDAIIAGCLARQSGTPADVAKRLSNTDLTQLLAQARKAQQVSRGTTHISVVDRLGNAAALTLSNGEGCGWVTPGTGIMMNNMLGEEDINPWGLGRWPLRQRMGSMMAPVVARSRAGVYALGSGGSNRIRSAVFQVLSHLLMSGETPRDAVDHPRVHVDGIGPKGDPFRVNVEPGFGADAEAWITQSFEHARIWPEQNLYFGGVHVAGHLSENGFVGAGDKRRAGVALGLPC